MLIVAPEYASSDGVFTTIFFGIGVCFVIALPLRLSSSSIAFAVDCSLVRFVPGAGV